MNMITKADCGELMSTAEARRIQIRLLDDLAKVCAENSLRYYLSGGTLLGAIRHHGYIPWDDDIDVNMPRPDCTKLIELVNEKNFPDCEVVYDGNDPYDPAVQWIRIYYKKALIENFYGGRSERSFFHPLFIDIFPIDGWPEGGFRTKLYCKELIFIRKMLGVSWHDHVVASGTAAKIAHVIASVPAKAVGYKRWAAWFQKLVQKYNFDSAKYIGVTSTIHYLEKERMEKNAYLSSVNCSFEGKKYSAPSSYDQYLSQLYGDYMQIPPEAKRDSGHSFKVYHRK